MVPDPILLIENPLPGKRSADPCRIWAYTTIPTVQEILAVHSTRIDAELLRRNADASWPEELHILTASDILKLSGIDFVIDLAALYRSTALAPVRP
jgi:hypothetical protein